MIQMKKFIEKNVFSFRIINTPDGNQVIDSSLKTPYDSLELSEMIEYIEMDKQMAIMDNMRKRQQKEEERRYRLENNLLWRLAYLCGLV